MLIRIRRLAGSVVGAAFILLLSLSMLQTGQSFNFASIFRPSPVVAEVGEEVQRWNTLSPTNAGANINPISALPYIETGYGPLLTALALKDSWTGDDFSVPRIQLGAYQNSFYQAQVAANEGTLNTVAQTLAPSVSLLGAQQLNVSDPAILLPGILQDAPRAIVSRSYDFDVIRLVTDMGSIGDPSEDALVAYLAENQELFQRPPTWSLDAVVLNDTDVAAAIEVTEDQVRQFYSENASQFQTPESWDYVRISFANQIDANLFQAQVNEGSDVEAALATSPAQVLDLGPQPRAAFDAATLDALAGLSPGDLTGPETAEDGRVTYAYLRGYTAELNPALEDVFDEASQALKLQTAQEQLEDTAQGLLRQANQENLALSFVAEQAGYSLTSYEGLQSAQTAPEELASEALFSRLQRLTAPADRPSRLTLIDGKREVLFQVTAYEGARDLTLEEGRDRISAAWQLNEASNAVEAQAQALADQISAGSDVDAALAALDSNNFIRETLADISRLSLNLDDTVDAGLIAQLDQASRARLGAVAPDFASQQILLLNPDLQSPFTLADGDIQQINLGFEGQLLVVATLKSTELDPEVRPALVDTLADSSIGQILPSILLLTYLEDVSATRPASVDNDLIDERRLAERQAQALLGGHGG